MSHSEKTISAISETSSLLRMGKPLPSLPFLAGAQDHTTLGSCQLKTLLTRCSVQGTPIQLLCPEQAQTVAASKTG